MTHSKLLAPILALLAMAGMAVAAQAGSASTTSDTTLTVTVPSTITMTGVSATLSGTTPAGVATDIQDPGVQICTNNAAGYTLTVKSGSANFVGAASSSFPAADDMVAAGSGTPVALSTTAQALAISSAPSCDNFALHNSVTPPATQPGSDYSIVETYVASTN